MRQLGWMSIAAGLALLAGCKDQDPGSRTAQGGSATRTTGGSSDFAVPRRADNGLDPARGAQDRAEPANKDAESASKDALNSQEKLRRDEQKLGSAPAQEPAAGAAQQSVSGTLAQASSDQVRVDSANQPGMTLKVTSATRVTLDGKEASTSQLREGAQVRASYSVVGDQPTALRIEAKSAGK